MALANLPSVLFCFSLLYGHFEISMGGLETSSSTWLEGWLLCFPL